MNLRRFVLYLPTCLLFTACFNTNEQQEQNFKELTYSPFEIKYAKGFSIEHTQEKTIVYLHDPGTGDTIDTLDISGQTSGKIKYFSRIIVQSTTHFAFLQKINALEKLVGLCGIEYLNQAQKAALRDCREICHAQGLDIEKVVTSSPDLVFLYPFGDQDKRKLNRLEIQTVFLTEYLESTPLARAEWLKFYALISGKNPNQTGFEHIEQEYLATIQARKPKDDSQLSGEQLESLKSDPLKFNLPRPNSVAFNLPFGDTWDMPSGNSISGNLVRDAGLSYFLSQEKTQGNLLFKLEEAYNHLSNTDYWIIIAARPAHFSMDKLLAENRMYANFPSVQLQHVFFCNTETTPYFSEAPVEPHLLLKDIVACLNGDDSDNKYFRILR